jgi:Ras-related protein Rab-7A
VGDGLAEASAGGTNGATVFAHAQVWEIAGKKRVFDGASRSCGGCDACVLVYDVTNPKSFDSCESWWGAMLLHAWPEGSWVYRSIRGDVGNRGSRPKHPENFPFVVLGNKSDLENRQVAFKRAQTWSTSKGNIPCFETSAKNNTNVEQAFMEIAKNVRPHSVALPYQSLPML